MKACNLCENDAHDFLLVEFKQIEIGPPGHSCGDDEYVDSITYQLCKAHEKVVRRCVRRALAKWKRKRAESKKE